MIDPIGLFFVEYLRDGVVDGLCARQVVSNRFLDDESGERVVVQGGGCRRHESRPRELFDGRDKNAWRNGQVVDAVAREAALVFDDIQARTERRESARVFDRHVDKKQ